MSDLQEAQQQLDEKQSELDAAQAEYETAMREKQVNTKFFLCFLVSAQQMTFDQPCSVCSFVRNVDIYFVWNTTREA